MPIEVISTNSTVAYEVQNGDDVLVTQGVTVSSDAAAIYHNTAGVYSDVSITVQGTLFSAIGIDLQASATMTDNAYVYVAEGGLVAGAIYGIYLRQGDDNVVVNHGEITGQSAGIRALGGEISVYNHGSISSFGVNTFGAVYFASTAEGSNIREVVNTGIITGAPQSDAFTNYATVRNEGGAEFHVDNSGTIEGVGAQAIYSSATATFINNSGLIVGNVVSVTAAELTNSGTINGDVTLSTAADTYTGIGQGVVTGEIDLGFGADTATMGDLGGVVRGDFGADTITGGAGSDEIYGDDENDLIRGRTGDDIIDGGSGNDTLRAGQGDDEITGGTGDDFIRGGAGEDIITGGQGFDIIFGGPGADTFIYLTETDSPDDNSLRDIIQDFDPGEDIIDFTAFAGLSYAGNTGFSGTGPSFYVTDANVIGRVKIFVDTNGDGIADMKIVLNNTTNLTEDDFLF